LYGGRERRWRTTKPCRNPRVLEYPGVEMVRAAGADQVDLERAVRTGYGGTQC
jgi:hypothetical protein